MELGCDTVPAVPADRLDKAHYAVLLSSRGSSGGLRNESAREADAFDGHRLNLSVHAFDSAPPSGGAKRTITFDTSTTYQTVRGFGNAFTDAAAIHFAGATAEIQDALLEQYWGETGAGFTIGRVPIGSTDFSLSPWTYDDTPRGGTDMDLAHFSIEHDEKIKIPLLLRALNRSKSSTLASSSKVDNLAARASGSFNRSHRSSSSSPTYERPLIQLFASCWAPPAWMTNTNSTINNPSLLGGPTGEMAHTYAQYMVKFFEAYQDRHGINFWAVTAGNEPAGNTGKWQDLKFTANQQRDFIKSALGPALRSSPATSHLDLLMLDDQRIHLDSWTDAVLGDPDSAQYVAGIALHWYAATEDITPSALYFGEMDTAHKKYGKKVYMMATEACEGFLPWSKGVNPGDWGRAETYAHDILGDLNHWAEGWTDWNAWLGADGGPNWANNQVDSPIIVDASDHFYKQPMYYALAHFSKYIVPGSKRIAVNSTATGIGRSPMECGAFLRPDGLIVLIVLNRGAKLSDDTEYSINVGGVNKNDGEGRWINLSVPPHSFQTILVQP